MLSVQSPGCAGMERLGAPGGAGGGGGGGDRTRQRRDFDDLSMASLQQMNRLMELHVRARGVHTSEAINCPHRIPLPDGEHGPDRHLQMRVPYQQSELTRSAIQAPPNKSVLDLPNWAELGAPVPARKAVSPHKKDGLMQKAVKYLVKISGNGSAGAKATEEAVEVRRAPCVMVPLPRAPPPPPPSPS